MPTISQLRVEMHEKNSWKGKFYVGNITLPASIDLDNLIVLFYPSSGNDTGVAELLIEKYKEKTNGEEASVQNHAGSQGARR